MEALLQESGILAKDTPRGRDRKSCLFDAPTRKLSSAALDLEFLLQASSIF